MTTFEIPADRNRMAWRAMAASGLFRRAPFDVRWLRSPAFSRAVEAELARHAFDVVHVDTLGLIPSIGMYDKARVALNHHNIESHMLRRRAEVERIGWKRQYFRWEASKLARLEQDVCSAVGINLVVSELDGARLRTIAKNARIAVVENGADPDFFASASAARTESHLVFSGTMGWYPNDDAMTFFLKEIWPDLSAKDPSLRLTIVGRSPTKELQQLATGDERITVTGAVADVRPYFERAAIYVCPMRDGGGTRLKVLDALAAGIPLVATNLAVEGLSLEPGRHFLPANTPQEFIDRVLTLRRSGELRDALAGAGRRLVEERYSWSVIGKRLEDAYRTLCFTSTGGTSPR